MQNKREIGGVHEAAAETVLRKQGYQILEKNFRCRLGEIDIIAKHKGQLVFVEVKYRRSKVRGCASEAVTVKKQRTISRVADFYIMKHFRRIPACRFDVVAIDGERVQIFENAFAYQSGRDF